MPKILQQLELNNISDILLEYFKVLFCFKNRIVRRFSL